MNSIFCLLLPVFAILLQVYTKGPHPDQVKGYYHNLSTTKKIPWKVNSLMLGDSNRFRLVINEADSEKVITGIWDYAWDYFGDNTPPTGCGFMTLLFDNEFYKPYRLLRTYKTYIVCPLKDSSIELTSVLDTAMVFLKKK